MKLMPTNMEFEKQGIALAHRHPQLATPTRSLHFRKTVIEVVDSIFALTRYMDEQARAAAERAEPTPGVRRLTEHTRLLRACAIDVRETLRIFYKIPVTRNVLGHEEPRVVGIAQTYLAVTGFSWSVEGFSAFITGFQKETALDFHELWSFPAAIKLIALQEVLSHANGALSHSAASDAALDTALLFLQEVEHYSWPAVLEPLVAFEPILQSDPAGTYALMDPESRELYRRIIAELGARSDVHEVQIAQTACDLAQESLALPAEDPRITARRAHIGYYLLDAGRKQLELRCHYRPTFRNWVRDLLRRYPDDFYVAGIQIVTLLIIALIIFPLMPLYSPLGRLTLGFLLLVLPASQGAVELLNHTITAILKPYALPKIDFSKGIPSENKTLVVVPTLLLSERQVRELVEDLEVRSLANQDPNIHFALLSDLPDSIEKPQERDLHPLVLLAGHLIDQLNVRYAGSGGGRFVMLHRHRVFNPRQGVWMGWERKRGKLLDLNRLLMGGMDCFPFKAGDINVLKGVRYVLTLDSDTKLPRDSVRRMVGAMAHPLHRAVVDPQSKIVVQGYGLMQPRVGITVHSAARSRLASIYSGQTGFDIYSRAISDAYQDLYGEGIFTGKGIYEVSILNEVLDNRFPQNALLSHDLIEGAYARAGLLSDVEVIDDYPSHYSAQNKRKHRWVRGDWQIARWIRSRVPNQNGQLVPNPISTISRWKILDNLRRSLVEPATFLLLLAGWFWLPGGAHYWTKATLLVIIVPSFVQMAFAVTRALMEQKPGTLRVTLQDSSSQIFVTILNFIFLAHQTLLMLDAIVRALARSLVTGERLLEWETAAEAEMGSAKKTPIEQTLRTVPIMCAVLAVLALALHPVGLPWILATLLLWACVHPITWWLNRPFDSKQIRLNPQDVRFLRNVAYRTWKYFARYASARHHGLLPDNVQEQDHREAARISPTNIGLLLNARQAALALGFLTLPEFAEQTLQNIALLERLPKWSGHLWNWYNTETLEPLEPRVASTVDSGNFLASLWTLRMGALEQLHTPIFSDALWLGLQDVFHDPEKPSAFSSSVMSALEGSRHQWLSTLLAVPVPHTEPIDEFSQRILALQNFVSDCLPWLQPKFASLAQQIEILLQRPMESFTIESTPTFIQDLDRGLWTLPQTMDDHTLRLCSELRSALVTAQQKLEQLSRQLHEIATRVDTLSRVTDFRPLLDPGRHLLTIGFEAARDRRLGSCYDLLASESRMAAFVAVAKGDIPQECWFRLGREHTLIEGHPVLLSWTGTMFEFLMPTLWMRTLPETLLGQSLPTCIQAQRMYVAGRQMPWGISEAGYSHVDGEGNYQYHAFGVPTLALQPPPAGSLVIAPYASVLALEFDTEGALSNLRRMKQLGWMGEFGFYESADYSSTAEHDPGLRYALVRSWMAHHQGMSLLSLTNLLAGKPFQRWFHADPRVKATELLLDEKPVQMVRNESASHSHSTVFRPHAEPATAAK